MVISRYLLQWESGNKSLLGTAKYCFMKTANILKALPDWGLGNKTPATPHSDHQQATQPPSPAHDLTRLQETASNLTSLQSKVKNACMGFLQGKKLSGFFSLPRQARRLLSYLQLPPSPFPINVKPGWPASQASSSIPRHRVCPEVIPADYLVGTRQYFLLGQPQHNLGNSRQFANWWDIWYR